jgi:hypothetical protein
MRHKENVSDLYFVINLVQIDVCVSLVVHLQINERIDWLIRN